MVSSNGSTRFCLPVCGGKLSGPSGIIASPNDTTLGQMHRTDPSCEWIVTARQGRTLSVTLLDMQISPEAGEGPGPETCGNSYLLVSEQAQERRQ